MKLINDNIIETIFSKIPGVVFSTDGLKGAIDIFRFCIFNTRRRNGREPGTVKQFKMFLPPV